MWEGLSLAPAGSAGAGALVGGGESEGASAAAPAADEAAPEAAQHAAAAGGYGDLGGLDEL